MIARLYKKDRLGNLRFWQIEVDQDAGEIITRFGVTRGEIQEHSHIVQPNSIRSIEEQSLSLADSKITKRLEQGFCYDADEALNVNLDLNHLGFVKPMLAVRYDRMKIKPDLERCFIQYKYNGHRCLVSNAGGEKVAYSRGGKVINSVDDIVDQLEIPEGTTLDGELYVHGLPLQTISSYVRRKQKLSEKLEYVVYDIIDGENKGYKERDALLRRIYLGNRARLADSVRFSGDIAADLALAIGEGYEGLIIRQEGSNYEHKRSKSLIKYKLFFDDEFLVVDISASSDGWAVLHCTTKDGMLFSASAPGTVREKTEALVNKSKYIGKYVNVKYPEKTKAGIPAQPIATHWRNKFE